MKVIKVDKPSGPGWCVRTDRTKSNESIKEWLIRKEKEIDHYNKTKNAGIEGIYLYTIQGMFQEFYVPSQFSNRRDMCYYIRYDYIKSK